MKELSIDKVIVLDDNKTLLDNMMTIAKHVHKEQSYHEGKPYHIHLDRCLQILKQAGCHDEDLLCAMYGHDLREDFDKDNVDILEKHLKLFPERVADIINTVSRHPSNSYEDYVKLLITWGSIEDLLIKLCDVTCNREYCQLDGNSLLSRYAMVELHIKLKLHTKYGIPYNNDTHTMLVDVVKTLNKKK